MWCDWEPAAIGVLRPRERFQFQCGAIGRISPTEVTVPVRSFQFQCGAIGRSYFVGEAPPKSVSIPVWCDWEIVFKNCRNAATEFQFQCGAIGRKASQASTLGLPRFNSSVVRLGVERIGKIVGVWGFQFQCGAIGRATSVFSAYAVNCFNSSVVRLGDNSPKVELCLKNVSIPVWCDWEAC